MMDGTHCISISPSLTSCSKTNLQIRHPIAPDPGNAGQYPLLQVNLGSQAISIHRFSRNPFVIETGPPN